MKLVFGDASFFIALASPRDASHERAKVLNDTLEAGVVTTQWVLVEVANMFHKRANRHLFRSIMEASAGNPSAEIIPASSELFSRGCDLYFSRLDKEWSLTDCISFAVMQDRGLTDSLTGDHHFEQAGFRALLR